MGTPDFATASLKQLVENGFNVVGVVTAADKPSGRGQKLSQSSVKKYALENKLKILQPTNLKDPEFIQQLRLLKADLQVVVAFRMLPELVWKMPHKGTFNLHASLLPKYRGAAPINWAIINGEEESGVTTFFIEKEIDTGKIILQKRIDISPEENAGSLHDRLMTIGSELVCQTVNTISANNLSSKVQQGNSCQAPKIFKEDCRIDWSNSLTMIHNKIRGLSPYPAAWSNIDENRLIKIFDSSIQKAQHNFPVGKLISEHKNELKVAVKFGFIIIHELQLSGKKRMKTDDFLRGFKLEKEIILH